MKGKNLFKTLLVATMVVSPLGNLPIVNAATYHNVTEGEKIVVTTQVSKLEDIIAADLKQYYEEGTMRITKVQDNMFEIDEQTNAHPANGPTNNCSSMYLLLDENTATLIDGGNGTINSYFSGNSIKAILEDVVKDRNLKIVLTHLHGDHVGLLTGDYLDVIPDNIPVSIHEADYDALSANVKNNYDVTTFKGGDTLNLSGFNFKVVDIPGHSDGSNAMIDYDKEVVISGDAIGSGTVWLFSENNLIEYAQGIDNLLKAIKDMKNPVFYCGHRWQQSYGDAHSNGIAVGEIGKNYVLEMEDLLKDIMAEDYSVNPDYAASSNPALYSNSDLNEDDLYPGIVAAQSAIDKYQASEVEGNYAKAIDKIVYQRTEPNGDKTLVKVSEGIKAMIDERAEAKGYKTNVKGTADIDNKVLTLDIELVDVYLDNSEYKNGVSGPGESYFNLLEFYADILQVQEILALDEYNDYTFKDVNGNEITTDYIDTFVDLLDRIYNFDPTTDLKYRQASVEGEDGYNPNDLYGGVDVVATSGDVEFTFHMDHHGFWGYELAGDTFMNKVVDVEITDDMSLREINTLYANFMQIQLPELDTKKGNFDWYILNNTDLENPYMYVGTNSDGKNEALLIDVDFYGETVINNVIKKTIEERYSVDELDTLYIYLTHLHLDHVNNLAMINQDPELRDKVQIIWPEAEEHPTLDGRDLITLFDYEDSEGTTARKSRVINMKDGDQIEILDHTFELLSIPDQHSNGGSGLVDTTMGVYYSGDTLGSQIHLGGTSIFTMTGQLTQGWLDSMGKTVDILEKYDVNYILTGHSPYPINKDYASWMGAAIKYISEQLKLDPQFSGLVVVENGKVINGTDRMGEIFTTGLTDKEVFDFASVNFRNFYQPEEDEDKSTDETPVGDNKEDTSTIPTGPTDDNTPTVKDTVKTGDNNNIALFSTIAVIALAGGLYIYKKKEEV